MPAGTYIEPWVSVRDELRSLFQDNAAVDGVIANAIISDAVYDQLLSEKGTRDGAVLLAQTYSNYYALRIKRYANTRGGTSVEWYERQKHYEALAEKIRTGKIAVGTVTGGGVVIGAMTTGATHREYHENYGVWPEP